MIFKKKKIIKLIIIFYDTISEIVFYNKLKKIRLLEPNLPIFVIFASTEENEYCIIFFVLIPTFKCKLHTYIYVYEMLWSV